MAYTEFYTDSAAGSNANGGSDDGSPSFTSAIGTWDGTSVYTTASTTGAVVGQFANVGGSYVARIVTVTLNTSLTLSTTAKSGAAPGAGVTTCNVGGAWLGPNGATAFPFGFITSALTNAAADYPRVNFKNGTNYAITAAMTHANAGPIRFQGYTTTPGDGGRATIDGGTSGASYVLINANAANCDYVDLILQNNGATGAAQGIITGASKQLFRRCVFNNLRDTGLYLNNSNITAEECEAFLCNTSNTAARGAFLSASTSHFFTRCIAHDNAGSNGVGFYIATGGAPQFTDCIAESNGSHGFLTASVNSMFCVGCELYNNSGDGARLANVTTGAMFLFENCNFVKNGGYGVNGTGTGARSGTMVNCGFGSGTQANTSGQSTGLLAMNESGSVTYAADVTPWVDPANGDFRINLAAAKGTGRGSFTQTAASYAGTVGYPDIGAAQHLEVESPAGHGALSMP